MALFVHENKEKSKNWSFVSTSKSSDEGRFSEEMRVKIKFEVKAFTNFGDHIKLLGNIKELGNWDLQSGVCLKTSSEKYPIWESNVLSFEISNYPIEFEYKYVISLKRSQAVWETFAENRKILSVNRPQKNYIYVVQDEFSVFSNTTLTLTIKSHFAQNLVKTTRLSTLFLQLSEIISLLSSEPINYNTLSLGKIAINALKNPSESDFSSYVFFISWCMKNISIKHTKILISATNPTNIWLSQHSELFEKANSFQTAFSESANESKKISALIDLRLSIFSHYLVSEDVSGLLITDAYLEKAEIFLITKILENVKENEYSTMIDLAIWVCQLFYLNWIRPKQSGLIEKQLKKVRKTQSLEIFRDLLNELMAMVLDVYIEIDSKVNHQDCEALAGTLNSEYKVIFSEIFQVASQFFIKILPILNNLLSKMPFICYNTGNCAGELHFFQKSSLKNTDLLVVADEINDETVLPHNTKALSVTFIENLYHACLLNLKKNKVPICIGYFPRISEGKYNLNITEDYFTIEVCQNDEN